MGTTLQSGWLSLTAIMAQPLAAANSDSGDLDVATLSEAVDSAFAFAADEDEEPKRKRAYTNLRVVIDYLEGKRHQL